MSAPPPAARATSRRGIVALALGGACILACALPVVGGVLAGTVLDRVLDSPSYLVVLVALAVSITVFVVRHQRKSRPDGC